MQHGCIQIVDVNRVFRHVVTEVIRLAVNDSRPDATSRHPLGIATRMMIPTVIGFRQTALAIDGATKFTSPDDERVLEHPPLLQIFHKGRTRLVYDATLSTYVIRQVAVLIPLSNEDLSESDTAFGKTTCKEAIGCKGPWLLHLLPIHLKRLL